MRVFSTLISWSDENKSCTRVDESRLYTKNCVVSRRAIMHGTNTYVDYNNNARSQTACSGDQVEDNSGSSRAFWDS